MSNVSKKDERPR